MGKSDTETPIDDIWDTSAGRARRQQADLEAQAADSSQPSAWSESRVKGGPFAFGKAPNPEDGSVSTFFLDTFEVTVGRMRRFVEAYPETPPPAGAGAHPLIAKSGWREAFNDELPTSPVALAFNLSEGSCAAPPEHPHTFTRELGDNERLPINCINWFEAFAFCIWEGGRLPTEAEWEYAATGGGQQREYPWGAGPPTDANAVINQEDVAVIGSVPDGAGRWGQQDLAGNVWEWVFDRYVLDDELPSKCVDCAEVPAKNTDRYDTAVHKGGSFWGGAGLVGAKAALPINRPQQELWPRLGSLGFRCARSDD